MTEKETGEEILETWFFEAAVYKDGKLQEAPEEAIQKRDELRRDWLPTAPRGRNEAPVVKLTAVYETQPTGWKVEAAVRTKSNTTMDTHTARNN